MITSDTEDYLQASKVVDWQNPSILQLAEKIATEHQTVQAVVKACFEWVRDEIFHSVDYQINPVICRASDVLRYKTGFCYAKSQPLRGSSFAHLSKIKIITEAGSTIVSC